MSGGRSSRHAGNTGLIRATRNVSIVFARQLASGQVFNVDALDKSTNRVLRGRLSMDASIIVGAFAAWYGQKEVNGWNYPPRATGRLTPTRGLVDSRRPARRRFCGQRPIEATYLNVSVDGEEGP